MPFKPSPDKKVRLESLSKKALVATVKTLQRRERALLNQIVRITKLEGDDRLERGDITPPAVPTGVEMDEMMERVAAATVDADGPDVVSFPWETGK